MPPGRKYVGPIDEKKIGEKLRELRRSRGMTQVELADKMGIDQSLLSEYERGVVRVHGALIVGFANALNATTDEILGMEKRKNGGNPIVKDRRFLRRLRQIESLSRRDKLALLRTIDGFLKGSAR